MLKANPEKSSQELLQGIKHGSIIMIQKPNKSPCNGNTRGSLLPIIFVRNSQPKRSWQQFLGIQKVFCFWNSCHTRKPLLETPMLPQWWIYARISNKRHGKLSAGVLLLYDNAPAHKSHTSRAAIRKCGFVELNHRPTVQTTFSSEIFKKMSAWATISR